MKGIGLSVAVIALFGLTGCGPPSFSATGFVSSEGGPLGVWKSQPQGCSRDPFDGAAPARTTSILTFLWDDPAVRDPLRDLHRFTAPDAPMRLELAHGTTGYTISLDTVKTRGTHLDLNVCQTMQVEAREGPALIPEGKPTLSGTLRFRCGQIRADVHFKRCEY